MRKGNLTREEAIKTVGLKLVEKLEGENCEFTNRVIPEVYGIEEFSASVKFIDNEGNERTLTAYYYQNEEDLIGLEDYSNLDWEIHGYEIW